MLCRTSSIRHPESELTLRTPLLIPSFSSRGFPSATRDGKSEIERTLQIAGEFITDVVLISAYDIHYNHLPSPDRIQCRPDAIFVDSGGYEVSDDDDYSSVVESTIRPNPWTREDLESVHDRWPPEVPAVFVSFDHPRKRKPLADQVRDARRLFRRHPEQLSLLLLKPETARQSTLDRTIRAALADPEQLGFFHIVGVTEKELGRTMLDRMAQISRLRKAMDSAGARAPLHVFGALDPLTVCLYYIAGAEIFDGLTWLRYAYHEGVCIYRHNFGALGCELSTRDDQIILRTMVNNVYALQSLRQHMQVFARTGEYCELEPHGAVLASAYDALDTKLQGGL